MRNLKIDWQNHITELIVVFIGITAAFALNNWNESKKEKELERKYLSSLLDETNYNIEQLEICINKIKVDSTNNKKAIDLLADGNADIKEILNLIGQMSELAIVETRTTSFESIKFSGGFEIISNFDLRNLIVEVRKLEQEVGGNFSYHLIPRELNWEADSLVNSSLA